MTIILQLPNICNLSCVYCFVGDRHNDILIDVSRWYNALSKLDGKHFFNIGWGEPSADPGVIELADKLINDGHQIGWITNLTYSAKILDHLDRNNIFIYPSYHPYHWDIDTFIYYYGVYKNFGFNVGVVNIVAYPPKINQLIEWKNKLEDIGAEVCILPFSGQYKDKMYPMSYTPEEKEQVYGYVSERLSVNPEKVKELTECIKKQVKCFAGSKYMYITPEGEAHRCSGDSLDYLGSIDAEIKVLTDAELCPYTKCFCSGLWKYRIEE